MWFRSIPIKNKDLLYCEDNDLLYNKSIAGDLAPQVARVWAPP